MKKDLLYSITALFDSPDDITHAAEATVKAGYTKFDVHSPYPIHGIDRAMKLKTSRIGYFALVYGVLGTVLAVGFMTWVTVVDYPLVIGGKPFWSWPAFVPIAFEITVLLASVLSVVTMIILYFRFPNASHPLHDTPYMKQVSSYRFGISIQADDPKFNEQRVTDFLRKVGGKSVGPVYYDEAELDHGQKLFDLRFIGVILATAVVVSAVSYFGLNTMLELPPFNWMSVQAKLNPQMPSSFFADGIGMRNPVPGTVARGEIPYPYKGHPEQAALYLRNPLLPTKAVLERGKEKFLTFCSPCHGNFAEGNSRLPRRCTRTRSATPRMG